MNEEEQKIEERKLKPITLQNGQYAVSPVPKTTTDFPFFYLTKHRARLSRPIIYEGVDAENRPVRWAATPNATIGSPGIDAHEAWTRLVKPTWEAYRTSDERLPNILPLGGVRQCLRVVGWGQGGWEARRLLRALNQIGATWCTADFSVPTNKLNADGQPTFRAIKGAFSRLAIYAIGEKHLTEEELSEGKFTFDFNLEDTLYIQFHPFEVAIQESQPQRYLDNEYMFSVRAAARRWYELMAAKIFGVVKNRGEYCEILYSWYVKHHHTLNRLTSRRRILQQMNEVIAEHLDSGFIDRVEYRQFAETGKLIDFVIRFYPGSTAHQSIRRVSAALQKRRIPPAGKPRIISRKRIPIEQSAVNEQNSHTASPCANSAAVINPELPGPKSEELSPAVLDLVEELFQRGIFRSQATTLLSSLPPDRIALVTDYIEYWDIQKQTGRVRPGLLVDLIKLGEPLPGNFQSRRMQLERLAAENRRKNLNRIAETLKARYEEFCRLATNRFIAEAVPVEEFDRRVEAHKAAILAESEYWSERPQMADQFARHAVRAAIAKGVSLPAYEDFYRQHLPRVISELHLDPEEFGIEPLSAPHPSDNTAPDALYAPPVNDQPQNGDILNS